MPLISIKSLSFIQSYSSGTVSQEQPFLSFPAATPLRQGFMALEECHSQVIHCAHYGLSFQTECEFVCVCVCVCVCVYARVCVCVCVNVRSTVQYKSTEGSLVSGLMEKWMTNKNSEMPFIVTSWVYPFLFSFYDFLNLFSPQGHPPPFLISCAAGKDTPHPVKKWFLHVPGLLIPTWHICHPLPLCCNSSSWSE